MFLAGKRYILAAILVLIGNFLYAGNDPEYRQTLFGRNGDLQVANQVFTSDLNFEAYKNVAGAIERTYYVKNAVRLMIDEESEWMISSDFTVSVDVEVTTEDASGATNTVNKTLSLVYKKGAGLVSGAITSYEFKDAVKVNVKIFAINKDVSWDVTKNLKLVNEIISLRDWGFNCSTSLTGIVTDSLFADEWKVKWGVPANFQTEYDLEWAWVDESAVTDYMTSGSIDFNKVFDNNATRITTSGNFYRIPLIYENNGRIYARVRMAQMKVNGQRVEGNWFYLSDNGMAYLPRNAGHEDNLNWQATTTFSEEGKRKTVVQYYDGSLRGRQTVTKDNTTGTTTVAESFYDYQGRAVINVLPAPTLNTIISFTKNFNQFDDARAAKTVYDKLDATQSSCNKLTAKLLATATGSTSQYYSPQNPLVNSGLNKFIPDAEGYPYAETRFASDGTGRVDAQGGVGPLFQVNSGKETKYYYESVDQVDLDALFGTDAGYASHYTKNWVRDANGQYNVGYMDMKGRTVATALAGTTPQNLNSIPSYTNALKTITRQLIDPETNSIQGNSIISSKSLMVAKPGNFLFNYYLSPEKLKMMLCTGTEFCFDCLYELNISIIPDCSDKVIAGFSNPVIKKNFNLGQYLTSCAGTQSPLLDTTFNVWLEEGAYTVVKELKLSTAARDWYREEVYLKNDTCKTKQSFIMQQYQLALSQQNCYVTCEQCRQKLGSEADFITRFRQESGLPDSTVQAMMTQILAAYQQAKANCDEICDDASGETLDELVNIRQIMLQDMMPPVGQYARLNDDDHPNNQVQPFNIFNPNRANAIVSSPPLIAPYRNPADYNAVSGALSSAGYTNEYGVVVLSQASAAAMTPEAFADDFQDTYAEKLLPYHPEFCKLRFAEANLKGAYRFTGRVQNTATWTQAVNLGFIQTSTTNPGIAADYLMQKDSFFIKVGFGSSYYTTMRNAIMSNYVSSPANCPGVSGTFSMGMWKLAQLSVFCHKEMVANSTQPPVNNCFSPSAAFLSCYNTLTNLPPSGIGHCEADMNMVWNNFKALYLSFRSALISQYLSSNCSINYSIFNSSNGYNYQERFIRLQTTAPYILSNGSDLAGLVNNSNPQAYTTAMASEADSICRSNSATWMSRLRRCNQIENMAVNAPWQWASDSAWLSKYLVKICKPGVDYMGHPFGAASLPGSQPPVLITDDPNHSTITGIPIRSFPQLISYYLNFRGIAIDAYCYPELVDFPKAYNVAPPTVSMPVVTVPEPCACERINYYKTKWQQTGSQGTFSDYLFYVHGTRISSDTLNMLVEMCTTGYTSTNPNCNFLTEPIKLPAIFQCRGTANIDSSKTCITCDDYNRIREQFRNERGIDAPIENPQTAAELAINQAFQDYINYKTGFSKLWTEYVEFGIACKNEDPHFSCESLNELLAAFHQAYPNITGDECKERFVEFMNHSTGRNYTYDEWMQEFIRACGAMPPLCQPVLTCSQLQSLIKEYYLQYGFDVWKNGNCQQLFTDFVNSQLNTIYKYDEIIELYRFICGEFCQPEVCTFPNASLLTVMYEYFRDNIGSSGSSVTECQNKFTEWFNSQLGSHYSWDEIVSLYKMFMGKESCVPNINQLCTPPYSCKYLSLLLKKFYEKYPGTMKPEDCRGKMEEFFSHELGIHITYEEIAAMYLSICGTPFPGCTGEIAWNCRELIELTQKFDCQNAEDRCECFRKAFNAYYGVQYTYDEIRQLYKDHCGFELNMCPVLPQVFNCRQLKLTLNSFYIRYPDGGASMGADCQQVFTAFFNNAYNTIYSFDQIMNIYLVQCGYIPELCKSKCVEMKEFVGDHMKRYENIAIPMLARQDLFTALYNQHFNYTGTGEYFVKDQGVGNEPLIFERLIDVVKPCLEVPSTLLMDARTYSLEDPDVLWAYRSAYFLIHPDGLPADCQADFTAWINKTLGKELTYEKIIELYGMVLGEGQGYLCNAPASAERKIGISGGVIPKPVTYPLVLCGLNEVVFPPPPADTSTCKDPWQLAISDAETKYDLYIDSLRRNFNLAWYNKCTNAKNLETFSVTYEKAEHHYTLYYYDQKGQLVRTVPPEGVDDRRGDATFLQNVKTARNTNAVTPVRPLHTLSTEYRYNTLGQVVQQKSPDGGLSKFWYDRLGRMVVSQNAQQALDGRYSYTLYDALGRIREIGQKPQSTAMTQAISRDVVQLDNWLNGGSSREQITRTVYDVSYFNGDNLLQPEQLVQRNLRNRISYTQVFDIQPSGNNYVGTHRAATYYSYDIHGSVDTLLQDYGNSQYYSNIMNANGNRYKKVAYQYDLISGKVNMVIYQPGYYSNTLQSWVNQPDRFYHRYMYDADNKLTDVYTSHDSLIWERDASYAYYKHGHLARVVLGQQQVQGLDYAYTLQGWLKGINSTAVGNTAYDMGGDGMSCGSGGSVARDAFGLGLHYYQNESQGLYDHKSINSNVKPFANAAAAGFGFVGLYNGNIAAMSVNIGKFTTSAAQEGALLYTYRYDQLNRLTKMSTYKGLNINTNSWNISATNAYREDVTYDANGNIKTYKRNGADGNLMDNLTYGYNLQSGKLVNNRLRHVKDAVGDGYSPDDIDNQADDNYGYDAIGNLVRDTKEGITGITWTVYGKINTVVKSGVTISYSYDAAGNRISKTANGKTTWYVRDATGNVMAVYEKRSDINGGDLTETEVHLYGSNRLGMFTPNVNVQNPVTVPEITSFDRGRKFFELSNHLSNVLTVVSDRKIPVDGGTYTWVYPPCPPPPPGVPPSCEPICIKSSDNPDGILDYYEADIINANDYYPFGMMMPGRKFSNSDSYRYGFNGQERDKELNENIHTAKFWEYDSRISRRWNIDPVYKESMSNYSTFRDNPIIYVDPAGNTDYYNSSGAWIGSDGIDNKAKQIVLTTATAKIIQAETKLGKTITMDRTTYKDILDLPSEDFMKGLDRAFTKTDKTNDEQGVMEGKTADPTDADGVAIAESSSTKGSSLSAADQNAAAAAAQLTSVTMHAHSHGTVLRVKFTRDGTGKVIGISGLSVGSSKSASSPGTTMEAGGSGDTKAAEALETAGMQNPAIVIGYTGFEKQMQKVSNSRTLAEFRTNVGEALFKKLTNPANEGVNLKIPQTAPFPAFSRVITFYNSKNPSIISLNYNSFKTAVEKIRKHDPSKDEKATTSPKSP